MPFVYTSIPVNNTQFSQSPLISLKMKLENATPKLKLEDYVCYKEICSRGREWFSSIWSVLAQCMPQLCTEMCRPHSGHHGTYVDTFSVPKGLACYLPKVTCGSVRTTRCQLQYILFAATFFSETSPSR